MMTATDKPSSAVIVGLGRTGLSCARYLHARGWRLAVTDTRAQPPELARLTELDAQIPVRVGGLDTRLLDDAVCVVASPGLSLADPFFVEARRRGLEIVGDIELFARAVDAPVAGITGTNGKSTVTTLVGRMAERAGIKVRVGGNLGEPALDLLSAARRETQRTQLYVLELSSFQLEATTTLDLKAAAVLNVSPDHLDRYESVESYAHAKARLFARCDTAVINLDDPLVMAMPCPGQRTLSFSLRASIGANYCLTAESGLRLSSSAESGLRPFQPAGERRDFRPLGVATRDTEWWLTRRGEALLSVSAMKIKGLHNAANALAALALGEALGFPMPAMLAELTAFPGLPHRSQWVADIQGVTYINDSKGTNVGATLAAVSGMAGPLVMIAGGDGKNQDFAPLADAFRGKVRHTVLIGRDGPAIARALHGVCTLESCASLEEAVRAAARAAQPGDTVLLSPACASLDMFRDYTHRGAVFAQAVKELAA
jgi:UDP-N-acetylmuramoylalanine--D-glutamate ligase